MLRFNALLKFICVIIFAACTWAVEANAQQSEVKPSQSGQGKALTSEKNKENGQSDDNKGNSPLPKSRSVGHTERPKSESNQQVTPVTSDNANDNEQAQLDKGLIDAQIDDVLSSAEFLALENSAQFATDEDKAAEKKKLDKNKSKKALKKDGQSSDDPEFLLNQLDESDLMDYVAEDDLWKEQLTIEDHP